MILLSIYPKHVEAIRNGIKKYEFRKINFCKKKNIDLIAVFETKPINAVTMIIKVGKIIIDDITNLWDRYGNYSGISKDYFELYYNKCTKGFALEIINFIKIKNPISIKEMYPKFYPPQRFYILSEKKFPKLYNKLKELL